MLSKRSGPYVSIITPTYNHAKFISACVRSVQRQTYRDWEQIVVDDGSTDETARIVESLSDDRLVLIEREHLGVEGLGKTYNAGLKRTNAELVAILEGDDTWSPRKLEDQVAAFQDENIVLCWSGGWVIREDGTKLYSLSTARCNGPTETFSATKLASPLLISNFICPSSTVIVRRSVLDRVGGFVQPAGVPFVDLPTFLSIILTMNERERFIYFDKVHAYWRRHDAQISRAYRSMTTARAKTIGGLRGQMDGATLSRLGLTKKFVREIEAYYQGRALLASGNFQGSSGLFRICLNSDRPQLRLRGLLGLASCSISFDFFRIVPTLLRYRIGRLASSPES